MYHDPFPSKLDHAIACARAVLPLASQIEEAPARVAALEKELAALSAQIATIRKALELEKAEWKVEWKKLRDEREKSAGDLQEETAAHSAKLAEARQELIAIQNKISSVRNRNEKIAGLFKKLERMQEHPSSGAAGYNSVIAQILEALR